MAERLPIVVYGASGYTGRLVCRVLADKGVSFAIAGRDKKKLSDLALTLGKPPEVVVAALDDAKALEKMAARARVVLDCAGPFELHGKPVQDAALAAKSHFLDITGEHRYMRATWARDAEAKARGVALINAVGFDVVPTDAAAAIAAEAAGAPVESVKIAFATKGARPTQGTTRSMIALSHLGSLAWVDGKWVPEKVGAEKWTVDFQPPVGRRTVIAAPWGDVATAPRTTGARNVRTFMALPPKLAMLSPLMKLTRLPGAGALLERWVRSLPEGPTAEQRARGRSSIHAEATGKKSTRAAWVTCGDGYDFTAVSASLCAMRAAEESFQGKGALTPTQAFGAKWLLEQLKKEGAADWKLAD